MKTNKERIENLEVSLSTVQNNFNKLELGFNDKLQRLEAVITKLSAALLPDSSASGNDHNEELWARFGPTECGDFDEALSRVRQLGSLRDYQREFEKLGNRVQGWKSKALVGKFIGGLQPEIADADAHHSEAVADCIEFIKKKSSSEDNADARAGSSISNMDAANELVMPVI
ncbi:hypothetical protein V6N11_076880 [Hibiscus sabdariffa]|uniref:Retrotransposon gag domain-containing protein n=1 Tax=Hibiscus sabdariffa TaxID=183260 RepID=A0ABR2TCC5_9ROSI